MNTAFLLKTLLALFITLSSPVHAESEDPAVPKKVRIYLLAGQSNMEGQAKISLLENQLKQPSTSALFAPFHKDGQWVERDDVWIHFLERKGPLKAGYGAPGKIGPELQFGWTMGDHFDEPVLLIKTAWGGRSLWHDFRSPSSGLPAKDRIDKLLENALRKNPDTTRDEIESRVGFAWREMIQAIQTALGEYSANFPDLKDHVPEWSGVVWFQGWNDMIDPLATAEYQANMIHFIQDLRKELHAPSLPFVIAQIGVDGMQPGEKIQRLKEAQAAAAEAPGFQGNVTLVKTDAFWDLEADAVFRKGIKDHQEDWKLVGSDFPFHYLGSAKTHIAIGRACAEALLRMDQP